MSEKTKICKRCNEEFQISQKEISFLDKKNIPLPKICHRCKGIQMTSFFNIRKVFERKCDITNKKLLSAYDPESPQTIIDAKLWSSDKFDAMNYGQDFDFSKPFFEQLFDFFYKVPLQHNVIINGENCDYCNWILNCSNCYMSYDVIESQNILYSYLILKSNDIVESFNIKKSQHCYSSVWLTNCYKLLYSIGCQDSRDSYFLADCKGCKNCFFCIWLNNQEYCIENKQYSKEDYKKKLSQIEFNKRSEIEKLKIKLDKYMQEHDYNHSLSIINCENSSGWMLDNCKWCKNCFFLSDSEDCNWCMWSQNADSIDVLAAGLKNSYLSFGWFNGSNSYFSLVILESHNIEYSMFLTNCYECFACSCLQNKKYCIMNKQYSKDEYFQLKEKIIKYAKDEWVYGEFFPSKYKPAPSNYCRSLDLYNISPEEIWGRIYEEELEYDVEYSKLPDDIKDITLETITQQVFKGKYSWKPYKFTKEELKFYQKMEIPLPNDWYYHRINQLTKYWNFDDFYYNRAW